MSNSNYKVEYRESPPLFKTKNGFFQEMGIYNCTRQDIVLINRYGHKHYVKPTSGMHNVQHVEIRVNTINGDRLKGAGMSKVDANADGISINLPWFDLERGPIYVSEVDMVICLPDCVNDAPHPKHYASYENALEEVMSNIKKHKDKHTVRIFANDPTGRVEVLYALVEGVVVKIDVTHYEGQEPCVFYIYNGTDTGDGYMRINIPIEKVLESKGSFVQDGRTYYIADASEKIVKCIKEHEQHMDNCYSSDELKKYLQAEIEPLKEKLKQKDGALSIEKEHHRQELNQCKQEAKSYRAKYDEVKSILDARGPLELSYEQLREQIRKEQTETRKEQQEIINSLRKEVQDVRKDEHENKIEKVRLKKAVTTAKSEETKLAGNVLKYILPPLVAAAGTYVAMRKNK